MSKTDYRCPVCGVGMFLGQAQDVSMLGCGRCGGQWLDNAGTKRVVAGIVSEEARDMAQQVSGRGAEERSSHYRSDAGEERRSCPICDESLQASTVPEVNIEIDVCGKHGTWFDANELDALARHFELKAAITDAEAAQDVEAIAEATELERRARQRQGLFGYFLGR